MDRLTHEQKRSYFTRAWNNYQVTGRTNMLQNFTTGIMFVQMTAKKGIEKYGELAEMKLLDEFRQLVDYKTFHGRDAKQLTT